MLHLPKKKTNIKPLAHHFTSFSQQATTSFSDKMKMQFGCAVQKQNRISSSLPLAVFEDTHTWIFLLLLLNRNQSARHVLEMAYSGRTEEPAFSRNGFLIDLSHVPVNYLMNGEMSPTAYMSFAAERNAIQSAVSGGKVAQRWLGWMLLLTMRVRCFRK